MTHKCERCGYQTSSAKNMEKHRTNTRHGFEAKAVKMVQVGDYLIKQSTLDKRSRAAKRRGK